MLHSSPLKTNLVLRFMKGRGAQETMKDALIEEKRWYRGSQKVENFSISHAASPSRSPRAHCRHPSMLHPLVNPPCLLVPLDALDEGDLYQVPRPCWQLPLVWGFKTAMIFGMSGGDLLLDKSNKMGTRSHMWDHNDMAQKWTTPSRVVDRLSPYKSTIRVEWL
jgi:hypothetical protein